MRPEKTKRVEVNPAQSGLAGLGNALSGLNLGSLPPGPSESIANPTPQSRSKSPGRVILRKETAHRGGKTVIVVHDFPAAFDDAQIASLAKELRQSIGTGGAVKNRDIELQGDHAAKIRAFLQSKGWVVAGV